MRILLVEDDPMIGKTLQQALQQDGYAVDWVTDGESGRTAITTSQDAYVLVLLDLGLPRKGGLALLRELALLAALLERPGAALSKTQLEERIYRWGDEVESNAVEVHIHNLRKKLGSDTIRTLRGVGYALA